MPSLFSGINVALQALLSQQTVMQVTEHNVANANTPGYRRQEAVLMPGTPYPMPSMQGALNAGQMGTGVTVDRIRQFNLEFYDGRYRKELAESKRWDTEQTVLKQVESTLAETSTDGLTAKMDAYFSSWQTLSNDPSNMALRADLKQKGADLVGAFNWRATALTNLRQDQDLSIQQRVQEINTIASQIAKLNVQIAEVKGALGSPNDLMDNRDQLLNRLSEIGGATSTIQPDGQALVTMGQHTLVFGAKNFTLQTTPDTDPAKLNLAKITWVEDGQDFTAPRGELAGLFDARDRVIPDQTAGLNTLAQSLVTKINATHTTGFGLLATSVNKNFFQPFAAGTVNFAQDMRLSTDIDDLNNIAAASAVSSPGDGNIAGVIAALQQNTTTMNGGTATFNQFYIGKVGQLGLEISGAASSYKDRKTVADSLQAMSDSVSGVSLDEEAANLVKSQRAYQAAARMITTLDSMLDTIINGMGR